MQFHKPKKKLQNHFIFGFMIFKFDLKLSKFQQFKEKGLQKLFNFKNFDLKFGSLTKFRESGNKKRKKNAD
jgi:hypothetical protein